MQSSRAFIEGVGVRPRRFVHACPWFGHARTNCTFSSQLASSSRIQTTQPLAIFGARRIGTAVSMAFFHV
ncbi:hypothetical protein [Polaromonas jejuensis]|uniref:Uncharacterized protein n=1 Tax=Polaromonas jejuensis TaxID=457502 RepID=A0ABW0Q7L4_9BURK|nr:hypothetical protein [Polaromonas jejuensis]